MYHAFFVFWPNVGLFYGLSYINISVPDSLMEVELKWKSPSMAAYANSFEFCLHGWAILTHKLTLG